MATPWRELLGDPDNVRWVSAEEAAGSIPLACVDGRLAGCRLGGPGGTAGELVLLLAVTELQTRRRLSPEQVASVVDAWADHVGPIHLHTDTDAMGRLAESLRVELERARAWVRQPPEAERERLLEGLAQPEHVGCGHLEQMLRSPEAYRVRAEVVAEVVRAVHRRLWRAPDDVEHRELEGPHREQAVLVFDGRGGPWDEPRMPMWCADPSGPQAFVAHQPALRRLRWRAVHTLGGRCAALDELEPVETRLELDRLGERQMTTTLERLAPGLPRYRVTARQGRLELEGDAGNVDTGQET